MSAQQVSARQMKAAISVSEMCRLLDISRSQFYWHVERGTFHPPMYMVKNKRPFFTASMAEDNLQARETGVGVNGQYVIFYEKHKISVNGQGAKPRTKNGHTKLMASLKSLGLENVTTAHVEAALATCFPSGIDGQDETAVLRAVFRQIKRSGSG